MDPREVNVIRNNEPAPTQSPPKYTVQEAQNNNGRHTVNISELFIIYILYDKISFIT